MYKPIPKPRISAKTADDLLTKNMDHLMKNIKYLRTEAGYRQSDMGRRMGTDPKYISRMERSNRINPTLLTLAKIAHILGVTVEDLLSPNLIPSCNASQ